MIFVECVSFEQFFQTLSIILLTVLSVFKTIVHLMCGKDQYSHLLVRMVTQIMRSHFNLTAGACRRPGQFQAQIRAFSAAHWVHGRAV